MKFTLHSNKTRIIMPIELYSNMVSHPSRACLITAKYLGIDIQVRDVDLFAGGTRTSEYLKINPRHTVPTLVDNGLVLFESRAIMTYLANQYAPTHSVYPQNARDRAQVDKMLYYDATGYYPALKDAFLPILRVKQEPPQKAIDQLKEKIDILEELIGEQKFVAGESPTLADISLSVSLPIVKILFQQLWSTKLEDWYTRLVEAVPQVHEYNCQVDMKPFLIKK